MAAPPYSRGCMLALMVLCTTYPAQASSLAGALPRPGLYRIDADGTLTRAAGRVSVRQQTDGATGAVRSTTSADGTAHSRSHAGSGAQTLCVAALPAQPLWFVPADFGGGTCGQQHTSVTGNGVVHTAVCRGARATLTVRKLAEDRWEYISETHIDGSGGASLDGVRAALVQQARHAATPQERDQAAQRLAALPQLESARLAQQQQARMQLEATRRAARTPAEAAMIDNALRQLGRAIPQKAVSKTYLTRIAGNCTAAVPPQS